VIKAFRAAPRWKEPLDENKAMVEFEGMNDRGDCGNEQQNEQAQRHPTYHRASHRPNEKEVSCRHRERAVLGVKRF
jgi:hypothetical protein